MYRAVKIVSREDFEYERTFEREFEGIQRYEQVSKDHPGLVDVLHVGRDDEGGFYYYVMELADDENGEQDEIDPESYKAKTLTSELRRGNGHSVYDCVKLGMSLANGLGHLHAAGLTHRDVKPSNIIFVNGAPKLADVGLVAQTGQRTYVGTEGYVPPEGPGTSSADLYSLAMVLYEAHTKKDRLDFPELPTNLEIPPTVNRDEWRALNNVICRAGSPDPKKRYDSAPALARALRDVVNSSGSRRGGSRRKVARVILPIVAVAVLGAVGIGVFWVWKDRQKFNETNSDLLATQDQMQEGITDDDIPFVRPDVIETMPGEADSTDESADPSESSGDSGFTLIDPGIDAESIDEIVVIKDEVNTDPDSAPNESEIVPEMADDKGESEPGEEPDEDETPIVANVVKGQVKLMSQPSGATVWINGEEVGITPRPLEFELGPVEVTLKSPGYHDYLFSDEVKEGFRIVSAPMLFDRSPILGSPWVNSIGLVFKADEEGGHSTEESVSFQVFDHFMNEAGLAIPVSAPNGIVQVRDEAGRWAFCDWVSRKDRESGYLGKGIYYRPVSSSEATRDYAFKLVIDDRVGTLILNSEPTGAKVIRDGFVIGKTPMVLSDIRQGPYSIQIEYPGFEVAEVSGLLVNAEAVPEFVELRRDASVVFGRAWINSQGMQLTPIGKVMVADYETQVRDFREYVTEMQILMPLTGIAQALNHPVVGVTRNEAEAFCEWLTLRERSHRMIRSTQRYRLPTDLEWSQFAGEGVETGTTPEERGRMGTAKFGWGEEWPPVLGAGNFADLAAAGVLRSYVIEGYNDGFPTTSPGGSFSPLPTGLYDLNGNVWEWVRDPYQEGNDNLGVVRGGGWNTYEKELLAVSYRNAVPVDTREDFYGFRYVLEDTDVNP